MRTPVRRHSLRIAVILTACAFTAPSLLLASPKKTAAPAAAPAAAEPAAAPASPAAPPAAAPAPVTSAATAPAGNAVFPTAINAKYASQKAGDARMHTCLDQYHANKTTNGNGGLKWIQKGGGYYSECSKKLKG